MKYLTFLTARVFDPYCGTFWLGLVGKLYLYLPLLTMGLMSREINNGTIKLLYSSPIKVREIVFGNLTRKLLARMPAPVLELSAPEQEIERLLAAARHAHRSRKALRAKRLEALRHVRGVVVHEEDSHHGGESGARGARESLSGAKTRKGSSDRHTARLRSLAP